MVEIANAKVQHKRMTRAQWMNSNYIPAVSELVYEEDTGFFKAGDGIHRFADLKYMTGPQGERGPQGATGERGPAGRDGVVTFENLSQAQRNSLKGDRGEPGPRGLQGPPGPIGQRGANGENSYIHTKYSDNQNGANMDSNSTRPYIGIYTGNKATPPTNASEYTWSKIRGNDGLSFNENLLPDSTFVYGYNQNKWEDNSSNSGLLFNFEHAQRHFGRGLHIFGTPNAQYKGLQSTPFNLVAKRGDKLTLSTDLGKDALTEHSTLQIALHYLNDNNQVISQEWKELDLATQGFEVKKYKRISITFTVDSNMSKCRVMFFPIQGRLINFYIDNIKLERGSVATEWCPAYEDLKNYPQNTPVYRIAKGDISGTGESGTETIDKNFIFNPDGIKIGDIVQDIFVTNSGTQEGFWKVTNVNGNQITVNGIGMRNLTSYSDITRRITELEKRPATPGFVNQKTGQAMNYWMGSKQEFDAISNKDANTVYDYYE